MSEKILFESVPADESLSAREVSCFLTVYSSWLAGSGATCIRLEQNVRRIAGAYGLRVEVAVMPRHVHLTVWEHGDIDSITTVAPVQPTPINYTINTELSRLSWDIADKRLSLAAARAKFDKIIHVNPQRHWLIILLVSLANASFCRLFNGDAAAMAVVGIATMAGYWLKFQLVARHWDMRAIMIVCAFVSSVLAGGAYLFDIGSTPAIAVGTSVLYLVPGIPFLNSFSDMLYRHYICAFGRFADAVVLTCCLSIGLCGGMLLMRVGMF